MQKNRNSCFIGVVVSGAHTRSADLAAFWCVRSSCLTRQRRRRRRTPTIMIPTMTRSQVRWVSGVVHMSAVLPRVPPGVAKAVQHAAPSRHPVGPARAGLRLAQQQRQCRGQQQFAEVENQAQRHRHLPLRSPGLRAPHGRVRFRRHVRCYVGRWRQLPDGGGGVSEGEMEKVVLHG